MSPKKAGRVGRAAVITPAASPDAHTTASYQALKFGREEGAHTYYITSIPIDDLRGCCVVPTRNGTEGYQRRADESRAKSIAVHLDGGGFVPAIVLAAQPVARLIYNPSSRSVSFSRVTQAFWVIDGQHRLWGYDKAKKRLRVSVQILVDLSIAEQARVFSDVNSKQRPVSQSLLLDVKALAERESAGEASLRDLFDRLAEDKKSPLYGRLSSQGDDRTKLSRAAFNRAFGPLVNGGAFANLEPSVAYAAVRNYLSAVAAAGTVPRTALTRSTPLSALAEVMVELLAGVHKRHGDAKPETLRIALAPLGEAWTHTSMLKGSKTAIAQSLRITLAKHSGLQISHEMLGE